VVWTMECRWQRTSAKTAPRFEGRCSPSTSLSFLTLLWWISLPLDLISLCLTRIYGSATCLNTSQHHFIMHKNTLVHCHEISQCRAILTCCRTGGRTGCLSIWDRAYGHFLKVWRDRCRHRTHGRMGSWSRQRGCRR
jgi:hypothetical protein